MKIRFFLILFILFLVTGCSSSKSTKLETLEPEPAITVIPTLTVLAPTSTLTPTITPTPTPAAVAIPLAFKGFQDQAYAIICVKVDIQEPENAGQNKEILEAVEELVAAMGMAVREDSTCEISLELKGTLKGISDIYEVCGEAFTGADFKGDLIINRLSDNRKMISLPLRGYLETSQYTPSCNPESLAPFISIWPKVIIKAFSEVYGTKALEGALQVPVLRFDVGQVIQEGDFDSTELLPVFQASLTSDDDSLIKATLVSLAEMRAEAAPATTRIIPLLAHQDKWLATLAADALRMIGPGAEEAIPALLVAIEDNDKQLAAQSAFALGTIGKPEDRVLEALIRHVNDADWSMSFFVQSSLKSLTGEEFTERRDWMDWWDKRP